MVSAALLSACDKPPPDEHLYTGMMAGGLDASRPSIDGATSLRDATPTPDANGDANAPVAPDELAATVSSECGPPPMAMSPFSRRAWLASVAQCTRRQYCEFSVYQRDLAAKVQAHMTAQSEASRTAAQRAWVAANARWQRAELFRFGPAAARMEPGGQNLRAQIYSFPSFDRCLVDEQTVRRSYAERAFSQSAEGGRGLAALEYLLFFELPENGCSPIATINDSKQWQALASMPQELRTRRAEYAARVAEELSPPTGALLDAWDPTKGNFTQIFSAPAPGAVYPTEQEAINALGHALYYIDRELKDLKLGRLLPGITEDCRSGCADRAEARFAQVSTDNLAQNLAAFRALFEGCGDGNQGLGFDDALRALGPAGERLADRMLVALGGAEQAVRELSPPLELAVVQDVARVETVYRAVKQLTDLLKTELITLLDIELPMSAPTDND
jgi:predicted lipoprotein